MTIAELNMAIDGYNDHIVDEFARMRYAAWWTASMTRAKKIPRLEQLMESKKREDKPIEVRREEHKQLIEKFLKVRDNNAR